MNPKYLNWHAHSLLEDIIYNGLTKVYIFFSFVFTISTLVPFIFAPCSQAVQARASSPNEDSLLEW